jgi:PEP-CTERM motif
MLMEIIVKQILRVAWFASACMFPMAAGAVTVDTGSEFWSSASSGNNFTLGTSQSFAFGTSTLTATAGTYSGTTLDLSNGNRLIDENNRGTDEQGLGVCLHSCSGDPGEIDPPNEVIQISLVAAEVAGYSNFSIQANSATSGEKLEVYGSNTSGNLGTFIVGLTSADGDTLIPTAQNWQFLNFISSTSSGNNVLLHLIDGDPSSVPEPGTFALLGAGLAGLGLFRRRDRKRT